MKNKKNFKGFRKLTAIILSLCMVISFSIPSFAAASGLGLESLGNSLLTGGLTDNLEKQFNDAFDKLDDALTGIEDTEDLQTALDNFAKQLQITPSTNLTEDQLLQTVDKILENLQKQDSAYLEQFLSNADASEIESTLKSMMSLLGISSSSGSLISDDVLEKAAQAFEEQVQKLYSTDDKSIQSLVDTIQEVLAESGMIETSETISDDTLTSLIETLLDNTNIDLSNVSMNDIYAEISEALTELSESSSQIFSSDIIATVIAQVQEYLNKLMQGEVEEITLTFVTNDGSEPVSYSVEKDQVIDLSEFQLEREGYLFAGWCSDEELTTVISSITMSESKTIYAKWIEEASIQNPFIDVKEGDYFYTPVLWAVSLGITEGTTPTTFEPNSPCTREQVVTFLWRVAGCQEPASTTTSFTDIKASDYSYKAVLWAVDCGLVKGTSATTFSPKKTCTRAEIVTILYRGSGSVVSSIDTSFTDVSASDYYATAVAWAVQSGVTQGTSKTTFSPNDACTRGQIVTFLYRFILS